MGRMLGMIGTPPLAVKDVLDAFYPLCKEGGAVSLAPARVFNGWGISGYRGGHAVYFDRQDKPAAETTDDYLRAQEKAARSQSPVILAHFRKGTPGSQGLSSSHPFHSRDFIFAHDGSVFNAENLPLIDVKPQGGTDSEHVMLWMLDHIYSTFDRTAALAELLKTSRNKLIFNSLTFLLSDGLTLWAYRDTGDQRLNPGETCEERENQFTLYIGRIGQTTVVCSEPLKNVSKIWQAVPPRALFVFTARQPDPQTIVI